MIKRISVMLVVLFFTIPLSMAQKPPDENIVVTANAYPVPFENLSRTVTVLTREDIQKLPAHSIIDVLTQAAAVDLHSRSPFGIQSDISIRGSAYSQVLVLVDGVRMNDSQTAHHNSDLPVQLQDVERIEVLLGPGSSIYGADAFGGIINIITRYDPERFRASISGGQNGFVEASASTGFDKAKIKQTISVTGNRSSGFIYDRDFQSITISSHIGIGTGSSIFVSHVNKEFGAKGFYGPAPSKEWTNQTLVSINHKHKWQGIEGFFSSYYRTHGDRFVYNIEIPNMFTSSHRTQSTGMAAKIQFHSPGAGILTVGGEAGGDWIRSNTLGNHSFARASLFTELQQPIGKKASVYPGLRVDYYSNFDTAVSPSLSGSWWVLPRIKLRSSVGRAFRIPTFTELYYHDPNNQGNASLKPERAWSEEIGADVVLANNWMGTITVFSRHESNAIDWIRQSTAEKWQTSNIRKLHAAGIELGIEHSFNSNAGFSARYSRNSADAGHIDYISKYVLDYARDSWSASAYFRMPLALAYRQTMSYKIRADGRSYCLLDNRLERQFQRLVAAVDFSNLLNSQYEEVKGVTMPGRWFVLSLRTR
jgi:outer membrane cobalamin receptor